jgi:hypothetical protein
MVAVAALIPQLPTITVVTLAELRQILRHADDVDIVMGVNIDKARRQYPPLTIYFLLRRDVQRRSDSHYSVALHRHIGTVLRPAAPVDHRDVFEKPVNFHSNYSLSTYRQVNHLQLQKTVENYAKTRSFCDTFIQNKQ